MKIQICCNNFILPQKVSICFDSFNLPWSFQSAVIISICRKNINYQWWFQTAAIVSICCKNFNLSWRISQQSALRVHFGVAVVGHRNKAHHPTHTLLKMLSYMMPMEPTHNLAQNWFLIRVPWGHFCRVYRINHLIDETKKFNSEAPMGITFDG